VGRKFGRARWRALPVAVAAISVVVCGLAAGPALAAGPGPVSLANAGVTPARGSHVAPFLATGPQVVAPLADIAACNPVPPAAQTDCNLTYAGGSVMVTNTTHLVFWAPSGYSFPSGYQALIERYLTDVAHDSGDHTNTNSVATQYYDTVGSATNYIQYDSTATTALTDTDAYPTPTTACAGAEAGASTCLTQTQLTNELDSFINSNSGSRGYGDLWFLVLPPKVQTCFDTISKGCGPYGSAANGYCGYHTAFTGGFSGSNETIWAVTPYDAGAGTGCQSSEPNNNDADESINDMSHEMNESITDPLPYVASTGGWWDANTTNGGEIGDQCNFVFGSSIGSTSSGAYNELVNGDPYNVQQEWSNASTSCVTNYGAAAPTAAFTYTPASPAALDPVSFNGTGSHDNNTGGSIVSYTWDFGDGGSSSSATPSHTYAAAGTYTVKLTVEDSAGLSASQSQSVTVGLRPTTLAYTGATSGNYNHAVTLSARLTDNETGSGIAAQSVTLAVGSQNCTAPTDAGGTALCTITLTQTPGSYTATASFGGDSVYATSSATHAFTINQEPTHLAYGGPTTAIYHHPFTASATLTDATGGAPVPGKTVSFTVGSDTCSETTDSSGVASCSITPSQAAGSYTMTATFGGDADYLSSSVATPFSITKEATTLSYDGPAEVANGYPATLSGTLKEDLGTPIASRTVTFTLGSGASAQTCTGSTGPSGQAQCTIADVSQPGSAMTVSASDAFSGDAYYQPSAAHTTIKLLYYTGRAYGASLTLLGAPLVFGDTGPVSTSVMWQTQASGLLAVLPFGSASGLSASVQTGEKASLATASATSLTLIHLLLPTVKASTVTATSTTTCSGSAGTVKIASLTIGGVSYGSITPAPNTQIKVAGITVTLNQQTPVTGADNGLLVNGLVVQFAGGTYILSSAESDIGNCPGQLSAARRAASRRADARGAAAGRTAAHRSVGGRRHRGREHRARGRRDRGQRDRVSRGRGWR
jgi:PKD repeat protein